MSAEGIAIVGASAGSGKTYHLTQEIVAAMDPGGSRRLALESLVAVTYTRKANAELGARIRRTLVGAGAFDTALRLPLAYIGTVHATCLRMLQEFAIDAGLSPNVDVVAGDAGKLLRQALEASLSGERLDALDRLAARFKLRWQPMTRRYEWLGPVTDIMDLARGNRVAPDDLPKMADRSVEGLLALLPRPEKDAAALDGALARELAIAARALARANDEKGATKAAIETIAVARARLGDDELDWGNWAKLARLKGSAGTDGLLVDLREVASRYEAHPVLHTEIGDLTRAIFEAARVGLSGYQAWKAQRRVVDYVDMQDSALRLLDHPRTASELAGRLKLVCVDEFQDTTPIQLALFVKLHALAGSSVWVGDRKQCIFEYAGADPRLMDAVSKWTEQNGGRTHLLRRNYRSRPELVEACSALFAAAFTRHGFLREEVLVEAERTTPSELARLPPFGVWVLSTKNQADDAAAIADGVARLLADPGATPVVDRATARVRGLRPGDIAVLVATNKEAAVLVNALHERGIRAATARAGLLTMPEGVLVDAALRWLLDDHDTLAAAKIDALLGFGGEADAWLERLIPASPGSEPDVTRVRGADWRAALASLRPRLAVLSPAEAVDQVLAALDVVDLCARWPDPTQRVANLDALRAIAAGYERRCGQEREAGTVAGLLRYFDDMQMERLRRDEMLASDDQHVRTDDGAVVVCTYHKAKGLEWPVVVLSSLDRAARRDAFEVCPESDDEDFNPAEPLAGRWIRYWPWPLADLGKVPLAEKAEASAEGQRVAAREEKERGRLLYVGFTRARDHLVLAVRVKSTKATKKIPSVTTAECKWLDTLADSEGAPLLTLPVTSAGGAADVVQIRAGTKMAKSVDVPARVWRLDAVRSAEAETVPAEVRVEQRWFARAASALSAAPGSPPDGGVELPVPAYRISPSNAAADWPDFAVPKIGEIVRLSGTMPLDAHVDAYDALGDAVHAFFATDVAGITAEERVARARRLLSDTGLGGIVRAESLVEAGDRLRGFVEHRWPDAVWRREVSVSGYLATTHGERRVSGVIDLLLETASGLVIVDHKTFPGRSEAAWQKKCAELAPQLAVYAAVVESAQRPVLGCWLHLPVGGACVEVVT